MVNKILNNSMMSEDSVWIMYNSENCDPYFSKFITNKTVVSTICILSNNKKNLNQKFLLVHSLDKDNISNFDGEVIVYNGENSLVHNMTEILKKLDYPKIIYLNYSDKMDVLIDILGYGTYRFLTDNIILEYKKANKSPIFKSSDELIYFLLDTKTEEDIFYMKIAAKRALDILTRSFNSIKIGMTEKQIQNLVHKISSFRHSYNNSNIISEDFSWEKELCPIVLTGPNLAKGGHSCPDDRILKPGDTIYMDFGIQIHLRDGRKYSSDIQRMGYAMTAQDKKTRSIPEDIRKVFRVLYEAVDLGIKNLKPDIMGYEIDSLVRNYIIENNYPNYNHATGHPIGELAHNPGTSISPKGHKRSSMKIRENGVYTIEPRIQIPNGGSIEEMVLVTPTGGVTLCQRQSRLYLI